MMFPTVRTDTVNCMFFPVRAVQHERRLSACCASMRQDEDFSCAGVAAPVTACEPTSLLEPYSSLQGFVHTHTHCVTAREITQTTSRTAPSRRVCGEQLERSVKQLYSRCRIRDADNSQSTHTSWTDITTHSPGTTRRNGITHPETSTRQLESKSKKVGTMRKFTQRRPLTSPGLSAAAQVVARGPVAGRQQ